MDKKQFLLRQIAKTNKKNFENYVVTRIIHKIDDSTIKYVTQQYVRRPENRRALTDLYLPQIAFHVEVDEGHHKVTIGADAVREADIIDITGHTIERIDATLSIGEFDKRIDEVIKLINDKISEKRNRLQFEPWNPEDEYKPITHINKGYMDADEDVAFYRQADACNCFGHNYEQWYKALARHAVEPEITIWFPKLYDNSDWHNEISDDEETIYERKKKGNDEFIVSQLSRTSDFKRLVFAKVRSSLGDVMYRFKGLYELDVETSTKSSITTHRRKSKRVKTYPPTK